MAFRQNKSQDLTPYVAWLGEPGVRRPGFIQFNRLEHKTVVFLKVGASEGKVCATVMYVFENKRVAWNVYRIRKWDVWKMMRIFLHTLGVPNPKTPEVRAALALPVFSDFDALGREAFEKAAEEAVLQKEVWKKIMGERMMKKVEEVSKEKISASIEKKKAEIARLEERLRAL